MSGMRDWVISEKKLLNKCLKQPKESHLALAISNENQNSVLNVNSDKHTSKSPAYQRGEELTLSKRFILILLTWRKHSTLTPGSLTSTVITRPTMCHSIFQIKLRKNFCL